ncbi:hypothetical protein [Sorangium sp. So ce128]|uniref:hypothetical protein n=1 Tax=Sorangium sp. So ce128 TaxID=3133281 RepID=UPI003F61D6FC
MPQQREGDLWQGDRRLADDQLPADFLVGPDGALLDVHYGAHAADHWELEQVIALAR